MTREFAVSSLAKDPPRTASIGSNTQEKKPLHDDVDAACPGALTNTMTKVLEALIDDFWLFRLRHNNKFLATVWAT